MSVEYNELFGFSKTELVTLIKVEKKESDGKPVLIVQAERENGKPCRFGVLEDAFSSFAKNTDKKEGKYISRVPSEFVSDGKKLKWINTPF